MASPFNVEFSVTGPPEDAQARAVEALEQPARAVGLRLTKRGPGQLDYRPRVQFPFLLMLWHNVNGEKMTVRFEPGDGGGTRVSISGAVARGSHPVASDAEHWSEGLGR
jgi:hypothetical protein